METGASTKGRAIRHAALEKISLVKKIGCPRTRDVKIKKKIGARRITLGAGVTTLRTYFEVLVAATSYAPLRRGIVSQYVYECTTTLLNPTH